MPMMKASDVIYKNTFKMCNHKKLFTYTEHPKKMYFSRATLTKIHCIKINHIWTHISYSYPYRAELKTKVCLSQNGEKCSEIARGQFSKITETAHLSGWEFAGTAVT